MARLVLGSPAVDEVGSALEAFAGHLLASCIHPWLAWRVSSSTGRALIVLTYGAAAFLTTLGALLLWAPAGSR